jgi:hypothetical protein
MVLAESPRWRHSVKSLTIEFYRHEDNDTGILRKGGRYILAMGFTGRTREIVLKEAFDRRELWRQLVALRYEADKEAQKAAVNGLGTAIRDLLPIDSFVDDGADAMLHVDLVTNPAELAMLPFELMKDAHGKPLLVRKDGSPVELTRRVRADSSTTDKRWPAQPRVLFAWASPQRKVPSDEHLKALRQALDRWVPAFAGVDEPEALGKVLTVLERATLRGIEEECRAAKAAGRPYTHVHLLAHGIMIDDGSDEQRFGLALHDWVDRTKTERAAPEALVGALGPLRGEPVIVTLAVCDGANMQNSRIPEKSVAHELHVSGFPVVVASQLPLTSPGSTTMVATFYTALFEGRDVRVALHETRLALYDDGRSTCPDWASLAVYVRLPERYEEYLAEVRLRSACLSLETASKLSGRLAKDQNAKPELVGEVESRLLSDIKRLRAYQADPLTVRLSALDAETHGLLGSAEKRLAEHYQTLGPASAAASREALKRSLEWYRLGHAQTVAAHWLGVQSLSLEIVLEGKVKDPARWYATLVAAEAACAQSSEEVWAFGSLAELWLIAKNVEGVDATTADVEALRCIATLKKQVGTGDTFPLLSTRRQLERYTHWWIKPNGYFPETTSDLGAQAAVLVQALGTTTGSAVGDYENRIVPFRRKHRPS